MLRAAVFLVFSLCWLARGARADEPTAQEQLVGRGRMLLDMQGCTACHSLDGGISAGPSFLGRYGKEVEVLEDEKPARRRFDMAYLRESVTDPGKAVSTGFPKGVMPVFTLTDEQFTAIGAALEHLGDAPAENETEPEREPPPMRWLALCVLWFVGGHLMLSSGRVRGALVTKLGEGAFRGLYSLVVGLGFLGTIWAYTQAPYSELWPPFVWTRYVPLVTMPLAVTLIVCGLTTRTPTQIGQDDTLSGAEATGILRVTRHPQLWGYVLFALSHLPPNGDAAALLFFGAFAALSVLGMVHIEHRRRAAHGPAWEHFIVQTSILPFGAILERRNRLVVSEIGWWRVALSVAIYAALLLGHPYLFGARALP